MCCAPLKNTPTLISEFKFGTEIREILMSDSYSQAPFAAERVPTERLQSSAVCLSFISICPGNSTPLIFYFRDILGRADIAGVRKKGNE